MWLLASPLSVAIGAGLSLVTPNNDAGGFTDHGVDVAEELDVLVGVRIDPVVTIGGRFTLSHTAFTHSDPYADTTPYDYFSMVTLDYAVAVQFQSNRVWVVPWLGIHDGWGHFKSTRYSAPDWTTPVYMASGSWSPEAIVTGGLTFGYDIAANSRYRVTAYFDPQFSGEGTLRNGTYNNRYSYQAFTFGVAFRL